MSSSINAALGAAGSLAIVLIVVVVPFVVVGDVGCLGDVAAMTAGGDTGVDGSFTSSAFTKACFSGVTPVMLK